MRASTTITSRTFGEVPKRTQACDALALRSPLARLPRLGLMVEDSSALSIMSSAGFV
jgi:hypothetical protein